MADEKPMSKMLTGDGLKAKRGSLKKSTTKDSMGPSEEELNVIASIYDEEMSVINASEDERDLSRLEKVFGITQLPFKQNKPNNGQEFARGLFSGLYSVDKDALATAKLRSRLSHDLWMKGRLLRSSSTRTSVGISKEDLEAAAKLYDRYVMELPKLAKHLNLDEPTLMKNIPRDRTDFASKMFLGFYTLDSDSATRKKWRDGLSSSIGAALRRKSRSGSMDDFDPGEEAMVKKLSQVHETDVGRFRKFFDDHKGDLAVIARKTGIPIAAFEKHAPKNAEDFTDKLLDGVYTVDMTADAKKNLRDVLRKELIAAASHLKHAVSKEWDGKVDPKEAERLSKLYDEKKSKLEELAEKVGITVESLKKTPPADGGDFAKKVLLGEYVSAK